MGRLGVHFSLSDEEVAQLRTLAGTRESVEYVVNVIEEHYFENDRERMAESDKAWEGIHRTLSDGNLTWDGGEYPLNHVVLGGEQLYVDTDFSMVLKTPDQVRDVAGALESMGDEGFRQRYFAMDRRVLGYAPCERDFKYILSWFRHVRQFWLRAASEGRHVLFSICYF